MKHFKPQYPATTHDSLKTVRKQAARSTKLGPLRSQAWYGFSRGARLTPRGGGGQPRGILGVASQVYGFRRRIEPHQSLVARSC